MKRILICLAVALVLVSCDQATNTTLIEKAPLNAFSKVQVSGLTTSIDGTANTITVNWKAIAGAENYEVQQLMPAPLDWQTFFVNLTGTSKTFPAPQLKNQTLTTRPLRLYWSGRVKAVKGDYTSTPSDPIAQEMTFDYTLVPFDGANAFKVTTVGTDQYQAEFHFRNDSNLTIHNLVLYVYLSVGPNGQSTSATITYPGDIAPGVTQSVMTPTTTITTFVPDYAYVNFGPKFDVN